MQIVIGPSFGGTRPIASPVALGDSEAQVAENCKVWSGEIRPWSGWSIAASISSQVTQKSAFLHGDEWLTWSGDVDCVRSFLAYDERDILMFTGDGVPKYRTSSGDVYPLGIPVPATAPVTARSGTGTENPVQVSHVYTYVTSVGWEGPNSYPSDLVEVYDGDTAEITGMALPPAGYDITKMRIYRLVSGNADAEYELVAEIDPAESYTDTMEDTTGDTLQTETYLPPPDDLMGLSALPGGILVGFRGREVRLSEPFIPYAWPDAHSYTFPFDVVGLGVVGTSVVVLTKGPVFVLSGSAPESMVATRLPGNTPCLSKRSVVSMDAGVLFASSDGICLCNGVTVSLLTSSLFSRQEWIDIKPENMFARAVDGKYVFFLETSGRSYGHVIDFRHELSGYTTLNLTCSGMVVDDTTNDFYLIINQSGNQYVAKWEGSDSFFENLYFRWRSKRFQVAKGYNLSAGQVIAYYDEANSMIVLSDSLREANQAIIDAGGLFDTLNEALFNETAFNDCALRDFTRSQVSGIMFRMYVDGELVFSQTITSNKPFRLPGGFLGRWFEFQIEGNFPVIQVRLGTSITEMIA